MKQFETKAQFWSTELSLGKHLSSHPLPHQYSCYFTVFCINRSVQQIHHAYKLFINVQYESVCKGIEIRKFLLRMHAMPAVCICVFQTIWCHAKFQHCRFIFKLIEQLAILSVFSLRQQNIAHISLSTTLSCYWKIENTSWHK